MVAGVGRLQKQHSMPLRSAQLSLSMSPRAVSPGLEGLLAPVPMVLVQERADLVLILSLMEAVVAQEEVKP
jgi:hypothetical protein